LLQSVARLHAGTWHWLSGHKTKARRLWRAGLEAAQSIGMPYEEARLQQALSFGLAANSRERRQRAERIRALEAMLAIVPIPAARAFECLGQR
jgi:hypothetical protein